MGTWWKRMGTWWLFCCIAHYPNTSYAGHYCSSPDDMSTLTDLPSPSPQTTSPLSLTDQSTSSDSSKQKALSIGPPIGGLKRNNQGSGVSQLGVSNMQPSMGSRAVLPSTSINALNARPHMVGWKKTVTQIYMVLARIA
jgi:hypothetical protein